MRDTRHFPALLFALLLAFPPAAMGQVVVGDMVLDRLPTTESALAGPAAALEPWNVGHWPGGLVPVAFEAGITVQQQRQFYAACDMWSAGAGVVCVPRTNQTHYLAVSHGSAGCWSLVGSGTWGARGLNLGAGCWYQPTIAHEIGHALGLLHEHQRADRDAYVTVDQAAIQPGQAGAFARYVDVPGNGPYDYASIMHYGAWTFSYLPDRPTLRPVPGQEAQAGRMGNSLGPTALDLAAMASAYGPPLPGLPRPLGAHLYDVDGTTLTLAWAPAPAAVVTAYEVEASYSPSFDPIYTVGVVLPPTQTAVRGTLWDGYAYIRVSGIGPSGVRAFSEMLTIDLVGPPVLYRPEVVGRTVSLWWSGRGSLFRVLARNVVNGPVIAEFPVYGTELQVVAPPGTYVVTVLGATGESQPVTVVVR